MAASCGIIGVCPAGGALMTELPTERERPSGSYLCGGRGPARRLDRTSEVARAEAWCSAGESTFSFSAVADAQVPGPVDVSAVPGLVWRSEADLLGLAPCLRR